MSSDGELLMLSGSDPSSLLCARKGVESSSLVSTEIFSPWSLINTVRRLRAISHLSLRRPAKATLIPPCITLILSSSSDSQTTTPSLKSCGKWPCKVKADAAPKLGRRVSPARNATSNVVKNDLTVKDASRQADAARVTNYLW